MKALHFLLEREQDERPLQLFSRLKELKGQPATISGLLAPAGDH
jgi:hypothetical protein